MGRSGGVVGVGEWGSGGSGGSGGVGEEWVKVGNSGE